MFDFFKKKKVEAPSPLGEESAIEMYLRSECQRLNNLVNELKKKSRDCTFAFDFNAVNVFAIERNWNNGEDCTIVGYTLDEQIIGNDGKIIDKQVVKEWYLYCSDVQHEKLVQQFNEFKKGKYGTL